MKNSIVPLIGIILAVSSSVAFIVGKHHDILDPQYLSHLIVLIFILIVIFIVILVHAKKALKSGSYLPPPKSFWAFVLNKVPTNKGKKVSNEITRLLVICSKKSSESILVQKIKRLSSERELLSIEIYIAKLVGSDKKNPSFSQLDSQFEHSNAILVIRDKQMELTRGLYERIDHWTEIKSDIPCLFMNKLNVEDEIDLKQKGVLSEIPRKYNFVAAQDNLDHEAELSLQIPWLLNNLAVIRASKWKQHATSNRSWGLLILTFCLIMFGFIAFNNSINSDKRVSNLEKSYSDYLEKSKKMHISASHINPAERLVLESGLNIFLDLYAEKIATVDIRQKLKLSVYVNSNDSLFPIAKSKIGDYKAWPADSSSIVGCSNSFTNHFVFYSVDMHNSDYAVWDLNSMKKPEMNPVGVYDKSFNRIEIKEVGRGQPCSCTYNQSSPENHIGILSLTYSDKPLQSITILLDYKDLGEEYCPDFLSNYLTQEQLLRLARDLTKIIYK